LQLLTPVQNSHNTRLIIYLIIIATVGFHFATIRTGHRWEGDFALYTAHAKNIANGHNYADTGYIFNPEQPFLAPKSYPPVYPLFLAPLYKLFGISIVAMKAANILTFAAFLLLFQHYVRMRLQYPVTQIAVVAAVAFSPWFWLAKDRILPDILFMCLIFGSILLIDNNIGRNRPYSRHYLLAIITGVMIYLAYGTRSLGLVLIPSLLLFDFLRIRWISKTTFIIVAIFSLLYLIQNSALETDQSYINTFKSSLNNRSANARNSTTTNNIITNSTPPPPIEIKQLVEKFTNTILSNAGHYHQSMAAYWSSNVSNLIDNTVYIVMGLLAITGFITLVFRHPSSGDCLFFVYVCLLLLVPFRLTRYLLPIIPFYLLYIFCGMETVLSKIHIPKQSAIYSNSILSILLIITLSYVGNYTKQSFKDIENGVSAKESQELFAFLRQNTSKDSVIISRKPRLIALFSERHASIYAWKDNVASLLDYFSKINATHIVVAKPKLALTERYSGVDEISGFRDWVANNPDIFDPIFENDGFIVYQIR